MNKTLFYSTAVTEEDDILNDFTFSKSALEIYHERKDAERIRHDISGYRFSSQEITDSSSPNSTDDCIVPAINMPIYKKVGSSSSTPRSEPMDIGSQRSYTEHSGLSSISGLQEVKEELWNVFIYPMIYPQFFPDTFKWSKILLFGPPGTGKTMLAKALALDIGAELECITSADLLSRWHGESEKKIYEVFETARTHAHRVILFIDEIDGLCKKRSSEEADMARRVKTELLIHLDRTSNTQSPVYLIGATNCPWDIDSAFLRRFHKKIYVPLPDKLSCIKIMQSNLTGINSDISEEEWDVLGTATTGYSGSDLKNIVMGACCERLKEMATCNNWIWKQGGAHTTPADTSENGLLHPTPNTNLSRSVMQINFQDIPPHQIKCRNLIIRDILTAIRNTPKSVKQLDVQKFEEFLQQ